MSTPNASSDDPAHRAPGVEVFRQVVDGMDEGILLTDSSQRVVFGNAFARHLFGFELAGRTVEQVRAQLSSASDGLSTELLRGEVLVTNEAQGRQTRCYLNVAPLSRQDPDDHELVWTFFELTEELANTQAFIDFSAELTALNHDLKRKNDEILRLSRTDALTGTANRATILEVLERAAHFGAGRETDLSVALFDLDGFHTVNDREGNGFGDELLRQVAAMTVEELREAGTLGRMCGDTFLVILPGADREQARSFAEEIRVAVRRGTGVLGVALTVTVGVAWLRPPMTIDALLAAAYHALRQGKAEGGNRVVTSP